MSKNILVAYATGTGSTAEVAEAIGQVIGQTGVPVDVRLASDVGNVHAYSAVVLGSSIRVGRWLPAAVEFLKTFKEGLKDIPVAYFTTCLTMVNDNEDSRETVLSYMEPVMQLAPEITPVGLGLFAGSLDPTRRLVLPAGVGPHGDYRDWEAIRAWAREIRPALLEGDVARKRKTKLREAVLSFTDLSQSDMSRFDLRGADLRKSKMRKTNLRQANLRQTNLHKADLHGADLQGAGLSWADLNLSNLQEANLSRANLMGTDLKDANLSHADLSQAILNGATLNRANLRGANLTHADLNWADLSGADLRETNMSESNVGWANLSNVDLSQTNLSGAKYNDQTKWPVNFSAEAAGCVFVGKPH